jgi:uncharacterized protein (DUF58 family)
VKLDPAVLARLSSLSVKARVIVDSALAGQHRAHLHGSSVEFAEHKEYSPGDELRHIDWKALGKLDRYYVKQFEQESQLTAYLVLDATGSMRFAGAGVAKVEYAAMVLAAMGYLVSQQQDKVGLYVFGPTTGDWHVPPRAKANHLSDVFAVLDRAIADDTAGDIGPADAIDHIGELAQRRRALVVVASDMFDSDDRTVAALTRLRAQRHDVVVLHVLAPEERTLPYEGLTLFEALEGDHKLLANPTAIRSEYIERMDSFLASIKDRLGRAGVDYHLALTNIGVDDTLLALLSARRGPRDRR